MQHTDTHDWRTDGAQIPHSVEYSGTQATGYRTE